MKKICCRCKEEKPVEAFRASKVHALGRRPECKVCSAAAWKKAYPGIAERHRKRTADYNKQHREAVKQRAKKYYEEHGNKIRSRVREWARVHPEEVKLAKKAYKANRRLSGPLKIKPSIVKRVFMRFNGKCLYCGKGIGLDYHLDHYLPISKGGTNDERNLVISCPACNLKKGNKAPREWWKTIGMLARVA